MNASSSADAIYPDLYPDIVSSTPFIHPNTLKGADVTALHQGER